MLIDQFRLDGRNVYQMDTPVFSTSAKVHEGMTAAELIKQIGVPKEVENSIVADKMLVYDGDMCAKDYNTSTCYVHIKNGLVSGLTRIKPQYLK
jgi:hypothetical protein